MKQATPMCIDHAATPPDIFFWSPSSFLGSKNPKPQQIYLVWPKKEIHMLTCR